MRTRLSEDGRRTPVAATTVAYLILLLFSGGLVVYGSSRGLDLSDETFYLIWLNDPQAYDLSYQPFGQLLSHWYWLLGRSLTAYRLSGVLALAAGSAVLGFYCQQYLRRYGGQHCRSDNLLLLVSVLLSFSYHYLWLLTPAYNFLGNLGSLLIAAGIIGWTTSGRAAEAKIDAFASLAVGIGGYVSFFGKPPLAMFGAGVAVTVLAVQAWRGIDRPLLLQRLLIGGALPALLIVLTVLPYGGLLAFLDDILRTQRIVALDNALLRLPAKVAREVYSAPPLFHAAITALLVALSLPPSDVGRRRFRLVLVGLLSIIVIATVAGVAANAPDGGLSRSVGVGLISVALVYAAILSCDPSVSRPALFLAIALALLPMAVAVGSFNDLISQILLSIPPALLSICILARLNRGSALGKLVEPACVLLAVSLLLWGAFNPYGYARSISDQTIPMRFALVEGAVLVDQPTSRYAAELRAIVEGAGFENGSPVIDLSGGGPGTVALLDGKAPVLPWITAITPHWLDIVWNRTAPEVRDRAWIIGPIHPRFQDTAAARALAARQTRYRCVGWTQRMIGRRPGRAEVWKPVDADSPSTPALTGGEQCSRSLAGHEVVPRA